MTARDDFLRRLDDIEERLAGDAALQPPAGVLTDADPGSGERWESGQVWAHVAEFVPYWIEQANQVIKGAGDDLVPFGRTHNDEGRIAAIERDRTQPVSVLWSDARYDIEGLRRFVTGLADSAWTLHGLHPTRGVMTIEEIVEEFLVGHLEEHAEQLDALRRPSV
jgi:hypothetical protein